MHEMDNCSFMPQVNKKLRRFDKNVNLKLRYESKMGDDENSVYMQLYDQRNNKDGPKQDKSTIQLEYE